MAYASPAVVNASRVVEPAAGGRPVWKEEYVDIRTDPPLDLQMFDPGRFASARPRR